MNKNFYNVIEQNPVIAAVKNKKGLEISVNSNIGIVFLLNTDILNLKKSVEKVKNKGKLVYLHIDLIKGLARDKEALEYVKKNIDPDGIISTKGYLIKEAKKLGMFAIQRFFIFDSMSLKKAKKRIESSKPDAIEILPGIIPKVIKIISKRNRLPVIASGLIDKKEEIYQGLSAGATGISTTDNIMWKM